MEPELIEHIQEVHSTKAVDNAKIKTLKKAAPTAKTCVFYNDMECRMPMCDMSICQKCPEGHAQCDHIDILKKMISRVLIFLTCFIIFAEL